MVAEEAGQAVKGREVTIAADPSASFDRSSNHTLSPSARACAYV